jgi:hypothetical protein
METSAALWLDESSFWASKREPFQKMLEIDIDEPPTYELALDPPTSPASLCLERGWRASGLFRWCTPAWSPVAKLTKLLRQPHDLPKSERSNPEVVAR